MFTKRQLPTNFRAPSLDGVTLTLSKRAKYLGVVLDSNLSWSENVKERKKKAQFAFYACRKAFGKSWGLTSKMISWIYSAIIRPILTYGSLVWWTSLNYKTTTLSISRVQRQACLAVTGALKSTPNDALDVILGIPPLKEHILQYAASAALRLKCSGQWVTKSYGHANILNKFELDSNQRYDHMSPIYNFENSFTTSIPTREDWQKQRFTQSSRHCHLYGRLEVGCGMWSRIP